MITPKDRQFFLACLIASITVEKARLHEGGRRKRTPAERKQLASLRGALLTPTLLRLLVDDIVKHYEAAGMTRKQFALSDTCKAWLKSSVEFCKEFSA